MDCETTLKGEIKMKKFAAIAAIMMMTTAPVFAAQGGFNGPSATQTRRKLSRAVLSITTPTSPPRQSERDEGRCSWVKLRGNITERLSDDRYTFRDETGTVNVEIDHKRWNGVTVTRRIKWKSRVRSIKSGTSLKST
jgi:uncharacterized protein (TIGR00156 family)